MKIFGHPLHLMLIHFPAALLPMDLVCAGGFYWTGNAAFGTASFFAMMGGVGVGWMAMAFGLMDLIPLADKKQKALKTALIHGGINSFVLLCYSVLLFISWKNYPEVTPDSFVTLVSKAVLIGFMLVGNYYGARLVLTFNIGKEDE